MTNCLIRNTISGLTFGVYAGRTKTEALDAMARDAGFENFADACSTIAVAAGEFQVFKAPDYDDEDMAEWLNRGQPSCAWAGQWAGRPLRAAEASRAEADFFSYLIGR